jgi:hypothetical protein
MPALSPTRDPCSFSNPQFYTLKHLSLAWSISFDARTLHGTATLQLELNAPSQAKQLVRINRQKNLGRNSLFNRSNFRF